MTEVVVPTSLPHVCFRGFLVAVLLGCAAFSALAATGGAVVSGVVRDSSGAALPGVTITVSAEGASASPQVAVTGEKGDFRIAGLVPDHYSIEAALEGFNRISKRVRLNRDQTLEVAFTIVPAFGETIDVVAKGVKTGEVAVLEDRRQAAVVSDSISAEEIGKSPDANASAVVERLTGVTVVGEKYVYVRGLGERYSGTTINGATLPTTETEKRVVPLDLFPAKLLEDVNVVKTYTPDKAGDFGSGLVEMSTTQFPNAATVKLTLGTGYRSGTTGSAFRRYAGGLDRFGRGGQPLPSAIPAEYVQRKSALSNKGFTPEELQTFGRSLIGDWTGRTVNSVSPGTDFSLTYGNTFDHLGVVFSAVSNHKYDTTDEIQRYFGLDAGNVLRPAKDFELTNDRESATAGLVGNLSLRLNDANRIFLNSILTRDGSSENRFQQGEDAASGGAIRAFRSRYQIEQVLSTRLRGEHNLAGPAAGSLLEWSAAHSRATNDSNLRDNFYREADPGVFTLQVGFSSSGETDFYRLKDSIDQAGLSHSTFFASAGGRFSGSVKAGLDHLHRTRDFGTRRFIFTTPNQNLFDLTLTPEELFTAENIRPGAFELREVTGINDAYTADHTIDAGYVMSDVAVGKWRFIGGARFESSDQRVTTFNPFDTKNLVESANKKNDVLPSLNIVNQLSGTTNVRAAYGRTVNRPEFRELSPFAFVEVTGGRSIAGNPALKEATLDSYDLRWETFPGGGTGGGEVMAASIFYKSITRPIERIVQPTSDLRTSFVNAKSAKLRGIELEYRRGLAMLTPALSDWSVNANYARITSRVTVDASAVGASTSSSRPLEGQADQSANLGLQFFRPSWGTMVRLLGSYVGKRLTDVGAFGLPDIYEQPYTIVDAVVSQRIDRFARGFELKLAGTNLMNEKREFLEGGQIQRSYTPGRGVSLSIAYSPF